MSEWPDNWFRDGHDSADRGSTGPGRDPASDRTVSIPHPGGQYQAGQYPAGRGGGAPPPGGWPDQPPLRSGNAPQGQYGGLAAPTRSPAGPGLPGGRGGSGGGRRWLRPRRVFGILAVVIALLLVAGVGTYFYLNSKLTRSNILVNFAGRPAAGSGTNWLITGSDSRQGLTRKQELRLGVGKASGGRSDTIMVLHIPASGRPLLLSIPRDSYVHIPGYGMNKINAAFSFGGPKLLAETVQQDTGLYINHYMDIGFGGFVNVVNDVGGVRMCLVHGLNDKASNLHLTKGCHVLTGGQALAYVRDRHNFATQDLQRIQDQRIFLKALLTKLTSTGVIFNPFNALPAASHVAATLTVDESTSLLNLLQAAEALRSPQTTTVPIANANYVTSAGDAVLWNRSAARRLFTDLQTGKAVPKSLITGSQQGT